MGCRDGSPAEESTMNSHQFENVYKDLGINLSKLGCVKLNLHPIQVPHIIDRSNLHYSNNPERFWINGMVCEKSPHVTLLYGLIDPSKKHVGQILQDYKITQIEIQDISYFDSPYKDEEYYCIIAHVKKTPMLLEGHSRLELLPHINTFTEYNPHFTLCYIKKDERVRGDIIAAFRTLLLNRLLDVKDWN